MPETVGQSIKPAHQLLMAAKKKLSIPAFVNLIYDQTTDNRGHKNYPITESTPGTFLLIKSGTTEAGNENT